MLHPHKSCIFSLRYRMFEKIANFCICWSSCGNDFMDFRSFFHSGPYAEFIYLEMEGICSCRPQPVVYVKPILFLLILDFPLFWEHFLCHWWHFMSPTLVLFKVYVFAQTMMKNNTQEPQEITFY